MLLCSAAAVDSEESVSASLFTPQGFICVDVCNQDKDSKAARQSPCQATLTVIQDLLHMKSKCKTTNSKNDKQRSLETSIENETFRKIFLRSDSKGKM